jgi:hypothetical protein
MNAPAIPRSPVVVQLIQRTQEAAQYLPSDAEAASDLFPPPYISDGPLADRMLLELHDAPSFNLCGLLGALALYGFVAVGVLAIVFAAVDFALWALSLSGRPA